MRSRGSLPLVLALPFVFVLTGRSPALAFDITCYPETRPPTLVSAEVVGPRTLQSGHTAPDGWNPDEGRLSRGGIHYLSTRWVEVKLVTDRCSQVGSVRIGAHTVTTTYTDGFGYYVATTPVPGDAQRVSHTLLVYFQNIGDGSTDTVTIAIGRQVARSSPTVEYSFPVVRVRRVQEDYVTAPITFSQAELFNTFGKALYETFNREQNSAVITDEDGDQTRIYGYDPALTYVTVNGLGVSFGFHFRIDETCQPEAYVQGRFRLDATFEGISMVWLVPPHTQLQYATWCDIATGIPGLGELIDLAFFRGNEAEVSAGVRGRIEEAIGGALPSTGSFNAFLDGSFTRANELGVNLMLPAPSVEIAVPYDAFDMARSATALPSDEWVVLAATGLARADHVAGAAPNVTLQSGPNGVPRIGTTDWPRSRSVERTGSLVWDAVPVSSLLALRTASETSAMLRYTPGCSIATGNALTGPVSIRPAVNDTAFDAQRLRPSTYSVRLFFFEYDVAGRCWARLSDPAQAPPQGGSR
jgi:hypothetical protein